MNTSIRPTIISAVLRRILSLLAPGGPRARLQILIYHRSLLTPDPLLCDEPDAELFDWQLAVLKNYFNVLPLLEAIERLRQQAIPRRAACITFDDGYADNADVALNILRRHNLPATFFIATGYLDGGIMWNDAVIEVIRQSRSPRLDLNCLGLHCHRIESLEEKRYAIKNLLDALKYRPSKEHDDLVTKLVDMTATNLPKNLMLSRDKVKELYEAGMEAGAHTINHPILATLDDKQARTEIAGSKEQLESIINERIQLFAYPNGQPGRDYHQSHVEMVKSLGFSGAVSTAWGTASTHCDRYQLPRFTPWDKRPLGFVLRLAKNYFYNK